MRLYSRDYLILTEDERKIIDKVNKKKEKGKGVLSHLDLLSIPFIYFIHNSLFPNNFLDVMELKDKNKIQSILEDFQGLIQKENVKESDVIRFIKERHSYFIIGSIFQLFNFGHHQAYLFPEFPLSVNYNVDYLLVGKNSGGYEFVFVELESVYGSIINQDGTWGTDLRKGLKQIEDWDCWIESNYSAIRTSFNHIKNPSKELPEEFYILDKSRIHYVVVCGRRNDYKKFTYRSRRKLKKENQIDILHYDNIIDLISDLSIRGNY